MLEHVYGLLEGAAYLSAGVPLTAVDEVVSVAHLVDSEGAEEEALGEPE
jgi:hypothetical protein